MFKFDVEWKGTSHDFDNVYVVVLFIAQSVLGTMKCNIDQMTTIGYSNVTHAASQWLCCTQLNSTQTKIQTPTQSKPKPKPKTQNQSNPT